MNTGTVKITAVDAGKVGNKPADTITRLLDDIPEITNVTNADPIIAGADREDDVFYLARILSQIRTPARAGNIESYKRWARESSEYVGKVGVDALRRDEFAGVKQNGQVGIYILFRDDNIPTQDLIDLVQNYIGPDDMGRGEAPIGATPIVRPPSFVSINVKINITPSPGFIKSQLIDPVGEAIQKFINDLDIGQNVLYHNLATVVNNINGVGSVTGYAISETNNPPNNNEVSDIEINNTQKASAVYNNPADPSVPNTITVT